MRQLIAAAMHPHDYKWGLRPWSRHSLVVLVGGLAYVAMGVTYITTVPVPSRESSLYIALNLMPLSVWGAVWIAVGVLAIISARWPPASETWGYSTLTGLAAWWSVVYILGVLFGAANQSLSGSVIWGLVAFLWWGIAGLVNPEPDDRPSPTDRAPLVPPRKER